MGLRSELCSHETDVFGATGGTWVSFSVFSSSVVFTGFCLVLLLR